MKILLFELSREHPTLPLSEAKASMDADGFVYDVVEEDEGILLVKVENLNNKKVRILSGRLALSFFLDELIFSTSPSLDSLMDNAFSNVTPIEGSFRVRCENHQKNKTIKSIEIEKRLGNLYSQFGMVDINNPNTEIRVVMSDKRWYVGKKIVEINRSDFENRKVQYRPFFSPVSLHPRLARAIVNLSSVKQGETLLDPFCGTGGILIEAGLIGINIIGSDIKREMVEGSKKNLETYRIRNYKLYNCDVGDIESYVGDVQAVVTDFPYGRASTTNREQLNGLYTRAFKSIDSVLESGRKAVVTLPNLKYVELGKHFLELKELHTYRVHRSLTRYIAVFSS